MATLGLSEDEKTAIERFEREVIAPSMASLVILDFWAEWCGPCKQLGPILEKVAADYADRGVVLAKIDVDADKLIADQFRVQSIPTIYAIFQGQPVADLSNYRTEAQLTRALDQLLGQLPVKGAAQDFAAEIAPQLAAAAAALDSGQSEQAELIFAQLLGLDPNNPEVIGGLARAMLAEGKVEATRALIDQYAATMPDHPALARAKAALEVASAPAVDVSAEEARLAANPDDHEARFAIANARMAGGDREGAADALLEIIQRDRDWNGGAARTKLLQLLEAAGFADPWGREQRRRLSAILFT
jgi:putative thioredoxin